MNLSSVWILFSNTSSHSCFFLFFKNNKTKVVLEERQSFVRVHLHGTMNMEELSPEAGLSSEVSLYYILFNSLFFISLNKKIKKIFELFCSLIKSRVGWDWRAFVFAAIFLHYRAHGQWVPHSLSQRGICCVHFVCTCCCFSFETPFFFFMPPVICNEMWLLLFS